MYFRPSRALPWITCSTREPSAWSTCTVVSTPSSVQARMMQISRATNRAGIPTEQTFSIPPPTPPRTISIVSTTKIKP